MKKTILLLLLSLSALLAACNAYTNTLQGDLTGETFAVTPEQTLGQTFTAHHAGLNSIGIQFASTGNAQGELSLVLQPDTESSLEIARITKDIAEINAPSMIWFELPPQADSLHKDYYFTLILKGQGSVSISSGKADAYDQGALYVAGEPVEAQMTFQVGYHPGYLSLGILRQCLNWCWDLLLAALLLILPGWALLAGLWSQWEKQSLTTRFALAAGLSLATYPLLMLWTDWIGIRLGIFYALIPVLLALGFLLWQKRKSLNTKQNAAGSSLNNLIRKAFRIQKIFTALTIENIALMLVIALLVFTRLWHIRTLTLPLWGDSVHHTTIVQLILDNQGLFDSWLPYTPYASYTTHFGFHASAAVFGLLSNHTAAESVLLVGQFINIIAILSLYPLAKKLSHGNHWAGLAALLAAGLLSPMPAFYINWGRYAQLAGQAIFPTAVFLLLEPFEKEKRLLQSLIPIGMTLVGMTLTYYRMPIFFLAVLPLILIAWIRDRLKANNWRRFLLSLGILTLVSLVLFIPLIPRIQQGVLVTKVSSAPRPTGVVFAEIRQELLTWLSFRSFYPVWFLVLAGLGWLVSLVQKNWPAAALPVGIALVQAYQFGHLIKLPFAKFVQPFSILIFLYIAASLMISQIVMLFKSQNAHKRNLLLGLLIIPLAVGGAWNVRSLTDSKSFALATRADQRAYQWINTQTPEDSLFLIEGFLINDATSVVGSDGGWWIPVLTKRMTTIPPQYALLNETPLEPDYNSAVVDLYKTLERTSLASPKAQQTLCEWGVTHLYIGQNRGQVGDGATPSFDPESFKDSDSYQLVYREDRVAIYEFNRNVCSTQQGIGSDAK